MSGNPPALLSVIVPCFNEEAVLPQTHAQLNTALGAIEALDFEIIYVDDGSRDATLDLLREIQNDDSRVRVIALSRNFGQQMAVSAGWAASLGDAVVVIDADLQDPPSVVAEMVAHWRDGADVAYGLRTERAGETRFKLWTARMFYRVFAKVSNIDAPIDAGDFRLLDRKVVDALLRMPERERFLRGMVAWAGFRQQAVPYQRAARYAGETKYPLGKMLRLAADAIFAYSMLPLRIAFLLGFLATSAAVLGTGYALVLWLFTDAWVTGWTALAIVILFMGGAQLMLIGVLGEYLGRTHAEVKRRPLYLVKERLGFPPTEQE